MSQYEKDLFSPELQKEIKEKFYHVDRDPHTGKERLFFENSGGSFRLKEAVLSGADKDAYPDCPDRDHRAAKYLNEVLNRGMDDARIIFNAKSGVIATELTATQMMFNIVKTIAESVEGTNLVTTALEHPSAFDAVNYYAEKLGKELRVAATDPETGGVPVENILKQIDQDTILLSVMYTSHFTGASNDIETIVEEARKIKPDLYIVVDAVQHAAHSVIDVEKTPVDAMNFGVYKFFGCRGLGVAYLSDRTARLPHHRILRKAENEWRLGSPVPLQMASVSAIVDYVCWLGGHFTDSTDRRALYVEGMNRINRHERALLERMLEGGDGVKGLRQMDGVTTFPDCRDLSHRDLIVPMGFEKVDHTRAVEEYEKRGVVVRETPMESVFFERILTSFGLKGALRISPLHCHGVEDVDRFLRVTEEIAGLGESGR